MQKLLDLSIRERKPDVMGLFVNENKTESVTVNKAIGEKINELLQRQEKVASHDIEILLGGAEDIQGANCHKTALYLMGDISLDDLLHPDNTDPETAGHETVENNSTIYEDHEKLNLNKKSFPFRVSFFKKKEGKYFAFHSITVLGITNKDRLLGFEKEGPYSDNPFRFIDVKNTLVAYLTKGYVVGLEK